MFETIRSLLEGANLALLLLLVAVSTALVLTSGDKLVSSAVELARRARVPVTAVGVFVVGLGTLAPLIVFSLVAVVQGLPQIALGAIIGTLLLDGAMFPGLMTLLFKPRINPRPYRFEWAILLTSVLLLVGLSWPWAAPMDAFTSGGFLPRQVGALFLMILVLYFWRQFRVTRVDPFSELLYRLNFASSAVPDTTEVIDELETAGKAPVSPWLVISLMVLIVSAGALLTSIDAIAARLGINQAIIGVTLAALCLSLPQLVTSITLVVRNQVDLFLANTLGGSAPTLLVGAGLVVSAASNGIVVGREFYILIFPSLLLLLTLSQLALRLRSPFLRRFFGTAAVLGYVLFVFMATLPYAAAPP